MAVITIPAFAQNRGPRLFDVPTGSSVAVPTNYCEITCIDTGETCVSSGFVVRSIDIAINGLVDCRKTQLASASLSTRIRRQDAEEGSYNNLVNDLLNRIRTLPNPCP